ncbi:hypothetical protein COU74_04455 [Candidatus Peregrinibacteria bacterium CG10_big_fil_rev_8_21_14_0_10_36_19]|nr:MAG: hypothetical protein COU74_04455 [Candidatus Peregrinibacteria bacterium CG10_big_fil_rev_8_21_14_0_10_36_19]
MESLQDVQNRLLELVDGVTDDDVMAFCAKLSGRAREIFEGATEDRKLKIVALSRLTRDEVSQVIAIPVTSTTLGLHSVKGDLSILHSIIIHIQLDAGEVPTGVLG